MTQTSPQQPEQKTKPTISDPSLNTINTSSSIEDYLISSEPQIQIDEQRKEQDSSWWGKQSIRFKTTLTAVLLSILPLLAVSTIETLTISNSIENQIEQESNEEVVAVYEKAKDIATNSIWASTLLGILVSGAGAAFLAYLLTKQILAPIKKTSEGVKRISSGDLDLRIDVQGDDEIAQLGDSINNMTSQLKTLLLEQQNFARQSDMLKNITLEMTKAFNVNEVFEIAVNQIRDAINSDRVVVYAFDEKWQGTIIAESVNRKYPRSFGGSNF